MISSIRSLCFNDDHQTFTIVLPSQYRVFRCEPFGMIFSRECEDLSLGGVATYEGYRFLALTGSPSPSNFNSKSIRIYDHQTGQICFENTFENHILTMRLGQGIVIICMHRHFEVWNTYSKQKIRQFNTGLNVHVPVAISPDSSIGIIAGPESSTQLCLLRNLSQNIQDYSFVAEESAVSIVHFSHNSELLATSSFNGNIITLWELSGPNIVLKLNRPQGDLLHTLDFSPDLRYLASCSKDGSVRIYNISNRKPNNRTQNDPICSIKIPQVTMPRASWMSREQIGIATLEGDFYKLTFNGRDLEQEVTSFLKRSG